MGDEHIFVFAGTNLILEFELQSTLDTWELGEMYRVISSLR